MEKKSACAPAFWFAVGVLSGSFGPAAAVEPPPTKQKDQVDELLLDLAQSSARRETEARARRLEQSPPGDPFKWTRALTIPGAGEWEFLGGAPDGSQATFVTRRNAERIGAVVRLWVRVEYRDPRSTQSQATWEEFDCGRNTSRTLHLKTYDGADLSGTSESIKTGALPEPVLPGTAGEAWLQWACKNIRAKAPARLPAAG